MSRDIRVLCLEIDGGFYSPLAWTDREISNKKLRRLIRKFRRDSDFVKGAVMGWRRLFNSIDEVKALPYI